MKIIEIECSACGREALLIREPVYEGLSKVGELLKCSACGAVFADMESVPLKPSKETPPVFSDEDRSPDVHVFKETEAAHLCRHCIHYVVNPFMQYCAHHHHEVEATDTCHQFTPAANRDEDQDAPR